MSELHVCGRCGLEAKAPVVRPTLANLAREARQDGRPVTQPHYAIEPRCKDKDACAQRRTVTPVTRQEEPR